MGSARGRARAAGAAWGAREDVTDLQQRGPARPAAGAAPARAAVLPRLRAADLRLTRRGVLVHRLLALDLLHEDASRPRWPTWTCRRS